MVRVVGFANECKVYEDSLINLKGQMRGEKINSFNSTVPFHRKNLAKF